MALGLWTVWAVLSATVASFVIGFLWYGPVMGKPYMRATGMDKMTPEEKRAAHKAATPGYLVSVATAALGAVVIAFLFDWAFPGSGYGTGWVFGISLGTAGWLAFYVPGTLTNIFFDKRPITLWMINAGHWLLVAAASGFFVGLFHPGLA